MGRVILALLLATNVYAETYYLNGGEKIEIDQYGYVTDTEEQQTAYSVIKVVACVALGAWGYSTLTAYGAVAGTYFFARALSLEF